MVDVMVPSSRAPEAKRVPVIHVTAAVEDLADAA